MLEELLIEFKICSHIFEIWDEYRPRIQSEI